MEKNFDKKLRSIPQVNEILLEKEVNELENVYPHTVVVSAIRVVLDNIRNDILNGVSYKVDKKNIINDIKNLLENNKNKTLRKVINATGTTLHTNFGRAILSKSAIDAINLVAGNYANVEYNIEKGERGLRLEHIEKIICDITGAESCMVVNNNAAATMITLSTIAKGRDVIISRGELIEIGGSFRIPEVMEESGAKLYEVGTTNKTKISDYKNAINTETTSALLKVHTSNYRVLGFVESVDLGDLVKLGKANNIPVIYDLGSGLFVDLKDIGIDEPTIPEIIKEDVDVLMFSGDKLLGGPQAGIIVGKKIYIDKMKKNPLARILRVDKMTIAALYATLYEYYDIKKAKENIPILKMLNKSFDELNNIAIKLCDELKKVNNKLNFQIEACDDQVGGGAAPLVILKGCAVSVETDYPIEDLEKKLRNNNPPIITRISKNKLLIDVRCLLDDDMKYIIDAFLD